MNNFWIVFFKKKNQLSLSNHNITILLHHPFNPSSPLSQSVNHYRLDWDNFKYTHPSNHNLICHFQVSHSTYHSIPLNLFKHQHRILYLLQSKQTQSSSSIISHSNISTVHIDLYIRTLNSGNGFRVLGCENMLKGQECWCLWTELR